MDPVSDASPALALEPQFSAERLVLKLSERDDVKKAQADLRDLFLDPGASADARRGLEKAILWSTRSLALRTISSDTFRPFLLWIGDNSPRTWGGHTFPGAAVYLDSPDTIGRILTLDGDARYVIEGRFGSAPNLLALQIITDSPCHAGNVIDGVRSIGVLMGRDIVADKDSAFTITLDSDPAGDRPNHLQTESGGIELICRDGVSDWRSVPTRMSIRRVDAAPPPPPRSEDEIGREVAGCLVRWFTHWQNFSKKFVGPLAENTLAPITARDGGWGYLAQGRFDLDDNAALVITVTDDGAEYANLQAADTWGVMADVTAHTSSYNKSQAARNPDGSITYVVSVKDPGLANWVDPAGQRTGQLLLRWQGVSKDARPAEFVRRVDHVKLERIDAVMPEESPKADAALRRRQLADRSADRAVLLRA